MKELRALTPEEFERAAERLRNPKPGSKIAEAKAYGVDLTLLIENLRLSPQQRVDRMMGAANMLELFIAQRRR